MSDSEKANAKIADNIGLQEFTTSWKFTHPTTGIVLSYQKGSYLKSLAKLI